MLAFCLGCLCGFWFDFGVICGFCLVGWLGFRLFDFVMFVLFVCSFVYLFVIFAIVVIRFLFVVCLGVFVWFVLLFDCCLCYCCGFAGLVVWD